MAVDSSQACRNLVLLLGDQLDVNSPVLQELDPKQDAVCMAEVPGESDYAWSAKARTVMFLSAMRHFRDELRRRGISVRYRQIDDADAPAGLGEAFAQEIRQARPQRVLCLQPGRHSLVESLRQTTAQAGCEVAFAEDSRFFCSLEDFGQWAQGRKQLRQEHFYRHMRKRTGVLMEADEPAGGQWNYDTSNRESFSASGPGKTKAPRSFGPDATTQAVQQSVNRQLADHPGQCEAFDYPVTHSQALAALRDFIHNRLSCFGTYQDAMWSGRPWLYHSRLSAAMNLGLLDPRRVVESVEQAWAGGEVSINHAEGFIRQVLGWREFVRGIYWTQMPEYAQRNFFQAQLDLPGFYWTGATEANCLAQCISQTLESGYAHHIQRLMVTGQFAMLLGVAPEQIHRWYLGVYVDAVEWVELPNTLGMSQFADGGIMASKPYCASGKYIQRMSNYCQDCRFDPTCREGDKACPFTVGFWDFLARNEKNLSHVPRMNMMLANLRKLDRDTIRSIRKHADAFRKRWS